MNIGRDRSRTFVLGGVPYGLRFQRTGDALPEGTDNRLRRMAEQYVGNMGPAQSMEFS